MVGVFADSGVEPVDVRPNKRFRRSEAPGIRSRSTTANILRVEQGVGRSLGENSDSVCDYDVPGFLRDVPDTESEEIGECQLVKARRAAPTRGTRVALRGSCR